MKDKGNFSKAFDELLHGKAGEMNLQDSPEEAPPDFSPEPSTAHLAGVSASSAPQIRQSPEATITADMVIKGSITSASNINIFGTVLGDVTCENDMIISGRIEGNINARSFQLLSGSISGDIIAKSIVEISQGATVNGNISAERVMVDSKVTGNISAANVVRLNANAFVDGNIKANTLSVQEGAELKGNVDIHKSQEKAGTDEA